MSLLLPELPFSAERWGISTIATIVVASLLLGTYTYRVTSDDAERPPLVPYTIPWVGSALTLGVNPETFLTKAIQKFGPVFRVKTIGMEMVYVTSPEHIATIYKDAKIFPFDPIRKELLSLIFEVHPNIAETLPSEFHSLHTRLLAPKSINTLLHAYHFNAFNSLSGAIQSTLQSDTRTTLQNLLLYPGFEAATFTLFDISFPSKSIFADFRAFDSAFPLLVAGAPRWILRGAKRSWDTIVCTIKEHLSQGRDGSQLVKEMQGVLNEAGWGEDIFKLIAGDFWALNANTMWAAYWVIALSLQHTDGLAPLLVEVDACWEAWLAIRPEFIGRRDAQVFQAWLDETPASDTPLLVSVINETLRFVSYTASVRLVAEPTHLAGYALRVGERVMCVARCVHMDPEVHADPSVFEPARYLHKDRKVHEKDGRRVANHTLVFGSGVSICPGRHFAMGELRAFLCILLSLVSIERDPASTRNPEIDLTRIGAAVLQAKGDMDVIVRLR